MKALTWQRWISIAMGVMALALAIQPVLAQTAALPAGLPVLPGLGEAMQRDPRSGLALSGYDPVAYQAEGRAVAGRPAYEITHRGAVWRFASAGNREAFRDAPEVYEPVFSGFDPIGVTQGRAVESDPRLFAVLGARLHLFSTPENRSDFVAQVRLHRLALANWARTDGTIAR